MDIREVVSVCDIEEGEDTEPVTDKTLKDYSFCLPLPELRDLLQEAYQKEPPDLEEDEDLESQDNLWWFKD
jgi:hypothetical protein